MKSSASLEIIEQAAQGVAREATLLFVHGSWHGAWCWAEHFLPYFAAQGYRSVALSLRGHGQSSGRERLRFTRLAGYVDDVADVVASLPQPVVLIGHSMGGLVVQKYLETHKVATAVLLASVPIKGVLKTTLRIASNHPLLFLKVNLTWSLYPIVSTPALAQEAFFSADMPAMQVAGYFEKLQDESYFAFLDMLIKLPRPQKVTTPLLVLGAAHDTIFHPDEVIATGRAYGTEAEIFPNMAHNMMQEADWQAVADRILAWLAEQNL